MERDEARKLAQTWNTPAIYEADDGRTLLEYQDADGDTCTVGATGGIEAFEKLAEATEQVRRLTLALADKIAGAVPVSGHATDEGYRLMSRALGGWSGFGDPYRNFYSTVIGGEREREWACLRSRGLAEEVRLYAGCSDWRVTADGQALVAARAIRAALGEPAPEPAQTSEPDPRPNFDGLSEQAAAARALHWLWGQAKDLPGYDKPLWMRLQRVVERRDAACGGES